MPDLQVSGSGPGDGQGKGREATEKATRAGPGAANRARPAGGGPRGEGRRFRPGARGRAGAGMGPCAPQPALGAQSASKAVGMTRTLGRSHRDHDSDPHPAVSRASLKVRALRIGNFSLHSAFTFAKCRGGQNDVHCSAAESEPELAPYCCHRYLLATTRAASKSSQKTPPRIPRSRSESQMGRAERCAALPSTTKARTFWTPTRLRLAISVAT